MKTFCEDVISFGVIPDVDEKTMQGAIDLVHYFMETQKGIYKMFLSKDMACKEDKLKLTPTKQRLIEVILGNIHEIENDMIATHKLAQIYNEGVSSKGALSVKSIGRLAASLKLKMGLHMPNKNYRGVVIARGDLERLRLLF
ncbi:MAG: hypothetical protein HQK65_07860 [Desulfamplus sp.]|nr:hypothetical protein [Desulfamplus sp.]